jgi:hypothetical protein
MVAASGATLAQGTGVPPTDLHRYPLPTYEEDWRALQTSDRTDLWDLVKSVPLSANGTTSLSLSGELRVTYERFANTQIGTELLDIPAAVGTVFVGEPGLSVVARFDLEQVGKN